MAKCNCSNAASCQANHVLLKLGINFSQYDFLVALAGNPNTGKSTVFNGLTGLRQHTGNWPGKTVSRAEGGFRHGNKKYKLVDLPGTYSLLSTSEDEEIARDFILFGKPDCTVVVVDATSLERNLNLVLQVLEITDKVVLCLNLIDEAERRGIFVDTRRLAKELGVPVVATAAREGRGLKELVATISQVVTGEIYPKPRRVKVNGKIEQAINQLLPHLQQLFPTLPNHRWVAMRLLDGDHSIEQAILRGELDAAPEALMAPPALATNMKPALGVG